KTAPQHPIRRKSERGRLQCRCQYGTITSLHHAAHQPAVSSRTRRGDMPRYILIESNTGRIWADTADLPGWSESDQEPIAAARLIDERVGVPGREYELFRSERSAPDGSGYHVWRADVAGRETLPVVTDGQDREMIAAVER